MADLAVDPGSVEGTGRGGRITKGDVLAATAPAARGMSPASAPPTTSAAAPAVFAAAPAAVARAAAPAPKLGLAIPETQRPEQRVPMSRLRQRVAERLVQSQSTAAILTTFNEVNMQPLIDLRNRYKERFEKEHGVKLGFMGFFVKAAVHALKKFPAVNASIDGADIVYHGYFDIGIAVGSPRGSSCRSSRRRPAVHRRDRSEDRRLRQARTGRQAHRRGADRRHVHDQQRRRVRLDAVDADHQSRPSRRSSACTRRRSGPVVENGQIVIRPMNYLAQSYDHRIIDGREAVLSLVAIKEALEDPARLLLDL
jgi:2-oxoglutarate dehydrogenase E2 component (dihydrolipoamide succinyltransferase)